MLVYLRNLACKLSIKLTQILFETCKTVCHCKLILCSEIKASVQIQIVANQLEHLQTEHKYERSQLFSK